MRLPRNQWVLTLGKETLGRDRVWRENSAPRCFLILLTPERRGIIRLVGALMPETNDEWAVARRQMSLETLARVTDNPTVRMAAVAT